VDINQSSMLWTSTEIWQNRNSLLNCICLWTIEDRFQALAIR
jgi:hypothetical protein